MKQLSKKYCKPLTKDNTVIETLFNLITLLLKTYENLLSNSLSIENFAI